MQVSFIFQIEIQVPGGSDGPSGVLVCSSDWITWKHVGCSDVRVPVPRRSEDLSNEGNIIVAHALHKMKNLFFFILQTELGDLFKLTVEWHGEGGGKGGGESMVKELKLMYFDTVPVSSSLAIFKSGFLFVASDFGHHQLFQIESLGDEGGDANGDSLIVSSELFVKSETTAHPTFIHRTEPKHLALVSEVESFSPLIQAQVVVF